MKVGMILWRASVQVMAWKMKARMKIRVTREKPQLCADDDEIF